MSNPLRLALLACAANAQLYDGPPSTGSEVFGDDAIRAARSPETTLRLHLMKDKGLKGMGAVCLDGSDAGFYFAPASNPADANNWQIYFQGGGWCYDETACWGRSFSYLGRSTHWKPAVYHGGIMSDNCFINPDFCNFNRVVLAYCDGMSFAGDREEPLVVTGLDGQKKPLYFRGRRILDAALQTLLGMGLRSAEQVLLTGCSAGGLAAYLHADYVRGFLKAAGAPFRTFKVAPSSGFFLAHNSVEGRPVYIDEMRSAFLLHNATGGLNSRCVAELEEADRWRCSFAASAYGRTETSIFVLNSALDSWQTSCIYTARLLPGFPEQNVTAGGWCSSAPGWADCSQNPEKCSASQMGIMNQYMQDFQRDVAGAGDAYRRDGNGAFIHSCHTHCEAEDSHSWKTFAIGGVTMREAVSKWWKSDLRPARENTYSNCLYHTESTPRECNPTCSTQADVLV